MSKKVLPFNLYRLTKCTENEDEMLHFVKILDYFQRKLLVPIVVLNWKNFINLRIGILTLSGINVTEELVGKKVSKTV